MFLFNRNTMYVAEVLSGEVWYWSSSTYYGVNRLFKYDYQQDVGSMIIWEILFRFKLFFILTLAFMIISIINALVVRIAIKSSVLVVFPALFLQNII